MDRERERMSELEEDLKATARDIAADAEQVQAIETEKSDLSAEDPRAAELAEESESLIERMAHKARIETALIDEAAGEA